MVSSGRGLGRLESAEHDESSGKIEQGGEEPFWRAPWEFVVHTVLGSLLFVIVAALAVALNVGVHYLEQFKVSIVIVYGIELAEYGLFAADLYVFGVFLWRTSSRMIRKI